jgi:hypothetical protein
LVSVCAWTVKNLKRVSHFTREVRTRDAGVAPVTTTSDGAFVFPRVPLGEYRVLAKDEM